MVIGYNTKIIINKQIRILEILGRQDDVNQIEEFHCDLYRVLAKIIPTISKEAIESFLQNSEIEQYLIKRKKTGILGAMVINDLYIFKNQTGLSKSDRIYFLFPYDTKKHIVFLGSINTSCFSSDNSTIIESYCKRIVDDICSSKAQD